jgi:hypothetical protein
MSNEKVNSFVKMVIEENLVDAQVTLKEYLNEKLTEILNEKFEEYAPTIFEEKGAKPDFLDLDKDGNTEEPMRDAAADAEGEDDDVETGEEQPEEEEEGGSEDEDSEEDGEEDEEECEDCEDEDEE